MSILYCGALLLILFIASIFAALETATVAISEHRLIALSQERVWARYALKLKYELDRIIIFSLFGNSLFNAALTTLSTMLVIESFGDGGHLVLTAATLFVTLIIIIFSEATPKIIASKSPLNVLRFVAIPLYYVFLVCKPIIWLIDRIIYGFTRLLGIGDADGTSLDDLRAIVADKKLPFLEHHRNIMQNSIEFEQSIIKDIVIPLRQVEIVDINNDHEQIMRVLRSSHHSKVIVCNGSIDNVIGYIKVRDLLSFHDNVSNEQLRQIIQPIVFVQDFLAIINELPKLQHTKHSIFAVINEYGDLLGIATITDMVELVFGDVASDAPNKRYLVVQQSKNEFILDGATVIRELNDKYHLDLPEEFDAMSINGLISKQLQTIPNSGTSLKINNVVIEILQVSKLGVERVKLTMLASK